MVKKVEFGDHFVRIFTNTHQLDLDLGKVEKEEIEEVKAFLEKMNFDNCFELS